MVVMERGGTGWERGHSYSGHKARAIKDSCQSYLTSCDEVIGCTLLLPCSSLLTSAGTARVGQSLLSRAASSAHAINSPRVLVEAQDSSHPPQPSYHGSSYVPSVTVVRRTCCFHRPVWSSPMRNKQYIIKLNNQNNNVDLHISSLSEGI
ncbi:hypothetical protein SAICODRAFT_136756 [Saitoella complicata NRRL Y-17804]|uniref:uncharacterized protein n=1 Tax=Saitoella complicata (strain BCRC 22490 / CBS 7301 / JCM 7358 / NBRC 10748 / NRRL Y-17804) TaxID=698492 RepID=UPI0008668D7E|nr:uncharacterized protein SAICODRAFT_136756 [Saitoella complicata NRRL Y-17804]ODQ52090.1 hypothetical protein SAICODRAFT_136756 [Saitoella complicata NRRL Y-17804]